METVYTKQQRGDTFLLYAVLQSTQPDKQTILKVLANTFINGMNAQERLAVNSQHPAERENA